MAAEIGSTSLVFIFLIGTISALSLFLPSRLYLLLPGQRGINVAIFLAAVISQLALTYSFVISDFSIANVYYNSHQLKPLIYKISGSWGNHEGSMILLILILAGYGLAFNLFSSSGQKIKDATSRIQILITSLFAAFTFFTSNPFEKIFPVPVAGLELNPLLQDIGLALHPPMLYLGYIGFSLIFSFSLASLVYDSINAKYASLIKGWLFLCYGFLTLGIALGSWWAYRELGWGGFWFWDPVENVSLMPWIAATAMIHAISILEKNDRLKIWSVFLGILSFILCLIGIFLVRSGVLTSVHSFAIDVQRGYFVIVLIGIIGGFGFLTLAIKSKNIVSVKSNLGLFSRPMLVVFNNYFLVTSLLIIMLGTVYPILSQSFFDQFISIGASYYNSVFAILLVPVFIALIIVYKLCYKENGYKICFNRRDLVVVLLNTPLVYFVFFGDLTALNFTVLFLALLAFFTIVFSKNYLLSARAVAMHMAHLGFIFVILGAIISICFGEVKEVNLKENESLKIAGYELSFEKIGYDAGKNFIAREAEFLIKKNKKRIGILKPQLRYYPVSDITTNEASIFNRWLSDIYLVIGNKDENNSYALRAYHRPFIYLIWIGALMIVIASTIKIIRSIQR